MADSNNKNNLSINNKCFQLIYYIFSFYSGLESNIIKHQAGRAFTEMRRNFTSQSWHSCNTASQPYLSVLFGPDWVSSSALLTDTTGRGKASLCWRVLQSSSLMVSLQPTHLQHPLSSVLQSQAIQPAQSPHHYCALIGGVL